MRRFVTLTMAMAVAALSAAPVTWAEDIRGKIKSVDPSGRTLTLEDGTQLMIPGNVNVQSKDLRPGADVRVSYSDRGSDKVVTSIEVHGGGAK